MTTAIYILMAENGAPIRVDAAGDSVLIELRTFTINGNYCGEVWQTIPRAEAVKMARAILEWAEVKE